MEINFNLQLFGGGGGGDSGPEVKQSAPGATAAATIDSASAGKRQEIHDRLAKARGRASTDKTGGLLAQNTAVYGAAQAIKKALIGE